MENNPYFIEQTREDMEINGAHLKITIFNSQKSTLRYKTSALLDTGASNSVVDPKIAESLSLKRLGTTKILEVGNGKNDKKGEEFDKYEAMIHFPWGEDQLVVLSGKRIANEDVILGREIIFKWKIIFNGRDGSTIIEY